MNSKNQPDLFDPTTTTPEINADLILFSSQFRTGYAKRVAQKWCDRKTDKGRRNVWRQETGKIRKQLKALPISDKILEWELHKFCLLVKEFIDHIEGVDS